MPHLDGQAAIRAIRTLYLVVPIVAISASEVDGAELMAKSDHDVSFLHKPFTRPALLRAISTALAGQRSARLPA